MNPRRTLLRAALVVGLAAPVVAVAAAPAQAATSYSGTVNCGTKYVQLSLSGATGTNASSYMHLDYGATSYTVHLNYEIVKVPLDYLARTRMHSVKWSAYLIGAAKQFPKPTAGCIGAPVNYSTHVTKSGYTNCGAKRVNIVFRGYGFEADVDWNNGPTTQGHRVYAPELGNYTFLSSTVEHAVNWTMTVRGRLPGQNIGPQFDGQKINCV